MEVDFVAELKTENLLLRKIALADAQDMFEYSSMPKVTDFLKWAPHTDVRQAAVFIEKTLLQYETQENWLWGIVSRQDAKLIGVVRMFNIDFEEQRGELSWILNPHYSGKGFATEAVRAILAYLFDKLCFERVQAKCISTNTASERLMQRCGMTYEGSFRRGTKVKGAFCDLKYYSILREEFYIQKEE